MMTAETSAKITRAISGTDQKTRARRRPRRRLRSRRAGRSIPYALVPLQVVPTSAWVASTKPGAALARGQGWLPWQGRGWFLAPRDRGPGTAVHCLEGHYDETTGRGGRAASGSAGA